MLDIDIVVELDEVAPLLLLQVTVGTREARGCRRGAAGLRDRQGAAGPHDGTGVSAGCGRQSNGLHRDTACTLLSF